MPLTDPGNSLSLSPAEKEGKCLIDWCHNAAHFNVLVRAPDSEGMSDGPFCAFHLLETIGALVNSCEQEWWALDAMGLKQREDKREGIVI